MPKRHLPRSRISEGAFSIGICDFGSSPDLQKNAVVERANHGISVTHRAKAGMRDERTGSVLQAQIQSESAWSLKGSKDLKWKHLEQVFILLLVGQVLHPSRNTSFGATDWDVRECCARAQILPCGHNQRIVERNVSILHIRATCDRVGSGARRASQAILLALELAIEPKSAGKPRPERRFILSGEIGRVLRLLRTQS